jgi:hypothetical protein
MRLRHESAGLPLWAWFNRARPDGADTSKTSVVWLQATGSAFQKRLESATESTERSSFHKSTLSATPPRDPFKSRFGVFERPHPSLKLDSPGREQGPVAVAWAVSNSGLGRFKKGRFCMPGRSALSKPSTFLSFPHLSEGRIRGQYRDPLGNTAS